MRPFVSRQNALSLVPLMVPLAALLATHPTPASAQDTPPPAPNYGYGGPPPPGVELARPPRPDEKPEGKTNGNGEGKADPRDSRRRQLEDRLRGLMANFGVQDVPTQDALLQYLAEDEASKQALRESAKRLVMGLRRDAPPARLEEAIATYKSALETDKTRRNAAQLVLDGKIAFSTNPRLEGVLYLVGILGDGAPTLGVGSLMMALNQPPRPGQPPAAQNLTPNPIPNIPNPAPPTVLKGTVIGTVSEKGAAWIVVAAEGGAKERYQPQWLPEAGEQGGFDPKMLEILAQTNVGDRVQLDWLWNERKRVVSLQPAP